MNDDKDSRSSATPNQARRISKGPDRKLVCAIVAACGAVAAPLTPAVLNLLKGDGKPPAVTINLAPSTPAPAEVAVDSAAMLNSLHNVEYEAAVRLADRVLRADPDNALAFNTKGSVAFYTGDFLSAAKFFEKAHSLRSDIPGYTLNLADTYVELRWYDTAIALYDSVRTASPKWWYAQGRAYLLAGRYRDAERLLGLVPTSYNRGTARILRAAALGALSDGNAARAELMKGIKQDPVYWHGILTGDRIEIHESYTAVAHLLEEHHVSFS